jgi:hypothetical protein
LVANLQSRIKLLGEQLKAIQAEISKRDFKELGLDKLLDYQLKFLEAFKKEYVEPQPLSSYAIEKLTLGASEEYETSPKLNSQEIIIEITRTLIRFRAGMADLGQTSKELALFLAMLRAHDQVGLEAKLDRLEAILAERNR